MGWTWVEQKSGAVSVRQYVYLSATVEMKSALDIGFDPGSKIASVWLTPSEPLKARVKALGTIKLVGDGLVGTLEKAAATAMGVDPKHQFAMQGAQMFEDKLRKGMTMTFDTESQQVDLMLSPLPNGVVPKRPFRAASVRGRGFSTSVRRCSPAGCSSRGRMIHRGGNPARRKVGRRVARCVRCRVRDRRDERGRCARPR